jgi:hypothetical protein
MALDQTLQEVVSRIAIQDALSIYCRGIDRLDERLIAAAYWPDAEEDHGIFKGTARDFAQHILGQSYVEVSGDRAGGETYVSSLHRCRKGNGTIFEAVNGRYVARFERRQGLWKISSRIVVLDFLREFEATAAAAESIPGLTFGKRGPADLSFSVLNSASR